MVSKKPGVTTPTKQKASETIVKGKAKFENGHLVIPQRPEATPIDAQIPEEVRKQTNGGIDVAGKKPEKKQKKKVEGKKTVKHPVVKDLMGLLPNDWETKERDGYFVSVDAEGTERIHSRNSFGLEYFSIRILPEKVSRIKTEAELKSVLQKALAPKTDKPESKKGQ